MWAPGPLRPEPALLQCSCGARVFCARIGAATHRTCTFAVCEDGTVGAGFWGAPAGPHVPGLPLCVAPFHVPAGLVCVTRRDGRGGAAFLPMSGITGPRLVPGRTLTLSPCSPSDASSTQATRGEGHVAQDPSPRGRPGERRPDDSCMPVLGRGCCPRGRAARCPLGCPEPGSCSPSPSARPAAAAKHNCRVLGPGRLVTQHKLVTGMSSIHEGVLAS